MNALTEPMPVEPVAGTVVDRYPGVLPFTDTPLDRLRFFGRQEEIQELLYQLLSVEILVFFGKSGVGKTSLLNAALLPLLRKRDFLPVLVRLNEPKKTALQIVIDSVAETKGIDYQGGRGGSLWEFFKTATFWRGGRLETPVILLDQFEEVFTLRDKKFREELIVELGQLTAGRLPEHLRQQRVSRKEEKETGESSFTEKPPPVKILISVREDYLGALQEFVSGIPSILLNRFRLMGLSDENARHAVVEPARLVSGKVQFSTAPFAYKSETLDQMITAARDEEQGGIEPFVLQLLCSHIEKQMKAVAGVESQVDSNYLGGGGGKGVRTITTNFYLDSIKQLPRRSRRRARALCEEGLLTENGRRRSTLKDDLKRFKLSVESLKILEDRRLLRSEPRHGSHYYEISHDRIADAIHNNRRWRMPRGLKWVIGLLAAVPVVLLIWVLVNTSVIEIANRNYDARNFGIAAPLFRIAAIVGQNAHAMNILGWMYQNHVHFKTHYSKAHKLLQMAADSGDRYAMDNLGWMYQNGQGVKTNYIEAERLFEKAANIGYDSAMNHLGWLYLKGGMYDMKNGERNDEKEVPPERRVAKNVSKALYWFRSGADKGNEWAKFGMGKMYENGWGGARDYGKAREWYQKAADAGNTDAKQALSRLH